MLYEATVKYATETKDQSLLKRVAEAEKSTSKLLLGKNPNIMLQLEPKPEPKPTAQEIAEKELADLQKQLDQLRTDHAKAQGKLYAEIQKEHEEFMKEAQSLVRK